jgi:hypothetical protein
LPARSSLRHSITEEPPCAARRPARNNSATKVPTLQSHRSLAQPAMSLARGGRPSLCQAALGASSLADDNVLSASERTPHYQQCGAIWSREATPEALTHGLLCLRSLTEALQRAVVLQALTSA